MHDLECNLEKTCASEFLKTWKNTRPNDECYLWPLKHPQVRIFPKFHENLCYYLLMCIKKLGQCIYNVRVCSTPSTTRNIGGLKTLLFFHSSGVVNRHFTGNIKVKLTSIFNEMWPEFAEPCSPYLIFRENVRKNLAKMCICCTVITEICTDNTSLDGDNTKLHCLGLRLALLSANQNCEINPCILLGIGNPCMASLSTF